MSAPASTDRRGHPSREATEDESSYLAALPFHGRPGTGTLVDVAVLLVFALAVLEPLLRISLFGRLSPLPAAFLTVYAVSYGVQIGAAFWAVRAGGGGLSTRPAQLPLSGPIRLVEASGQVDLGAPTGRNRGAPSVSGLHVTVPVHWRRYLTWDYGVVKSTVSRAFVFVAGWPEAGALDGVRTETDGERTRRRSRAVADLHIPLELDRAPGPDGGRARLRIAEEVPLGLRETLPFHPARRLALLGAVVPLRYALVYGPVALLLAPGAAGPFWTSPLGTATAAALVTLVPFAGWALARHRPALRRIRRHYAETQGVHPVGAAARVRQWVASMAGRTAPPDVLYRTETDDVPAVTPAPAPPPHPEPGPFPDRLVERAEWEHPAVVTPGRAVLRLVPTEAARRHRAHGTLTLRVVEGAPGSGRPTETRYDAVHEGYPVRVPQTAQAGTVFRVEVQIEATDLTETVRHTETVHPPPLLVLGTALFVRGPSWSERRCAEGDVVAVGGVTRGLPLGAPVRIKVEGHADGPNEDGDLTARTVVMATLAAEVGVEGLIAVDWRAERSPPLHDEATALGWDPPVYRATVEALGLVRVSGGLVVDPAGGSDDPVRGRTRSDTA